MSIMEYARPIIETCIALISVWELLEEIAQVASFVGCIILAVLLKELKPLRSGKSCLLFVLAAVLGSIGFTLSFAAFDPCCSSADYTLVIINTLLSVFLLLLYRVGAEVIKEFRRKERENADDGSL